MPGKTDLGEQVRSMFWPAGVHPVIRLLQFLLMMSGVLGLASMGDDASKWGQVVNGFVADYRAAIAGGLGLIGLTLDETGLDIAFLVLLALLAANLGYYQSTGRVLAVEMAKTFLAFLFFVPIMILQAVRDLTRDRRPGRLTARIIAASRTIVNKYSLDAMSARLIQDSLRALKDDPFSAWWFMASMLAIAALAIAAVLESTGALYALGMDLGPSPISRAMGTIEGWFYTGLLLWFVFFISGGIFALRWVIATFAAFVVVTLINWAYLGFPL